MSGIDPTKYQTLKVSEVIPDPSNARQHGPRNLEAIKASLQAFGQQKPIVVDDRQICLAGNGTLEAVKALGWETVEVVRSGLDPAEAIAYGIADNRTAELAEWDTGALEKLLSGLDEDMQALLQFGAEDLADLTRPDDEAEAAAELVKDEPETRVLRARRDLGLDAIYTFSPLNGSCWVATDAGLLIGANSKEAGLVEKRARWEWNHQLTFIDNPWHEYDHERHLDVVGAFGPKYATTRDLLTKKQAQEAGVDYYSFDHIMKWAEQVAGLAENVIVIPKYDCLDDIPPEYVIGYSVPSSYGGTPIPIERFRGRRIHLLGGSWATQLKYLSLMKEDIVSVDFNLINKTAEFGGFVHRDGTSAQIGDFIPYQLHNGKMACVALSLGAIATALREIFPPQEPADG